MVFGKKRPPETGNDRVDDIHAYRTVPTLVVCAKGITAEDHPLLAALKERLPGTTVELHELTQIAQDSAILNRATAVLAVCGEPVELTLLLENMVAVRKRRGDGTPTLIIAAQLDRLTDLGKWLYDMAVAEKLEGTRLIASSTLADISDQIRGKLEPSPGSNTIKMPATPELETTTYKYLFLFSPELKQVVSFMRQLAENGVTRIYLLGGPGAGKTSVAYYYYLSRGKGNFVQVNLTAESTGDKASMKSLLCGHVSGAFAGSGSREGALSFARDGVCFLDESHGVTGVVMQVLMEVLDSGQFLPFGATAKRALECGVIFASNRSWETLRSMMHLDEHARLGATLVRIPDLVARPEDLLAVLSTTLAKFASQCTTWTPPTGLSPSAWQAITTCPWRGNTRTLIRVMETAAVSFASGGGTGLIDLPHIQEGLRLWEPEDEHPDKDLYVSFR